MAEIPAPTGGFGSSVTASPAPNPRGAMRTWREAAAFAATVQRASGSAIDQAVSELSVEQVRALAVALATQVDLGAAAAADEVNDTGPSGIWSTAVAAAARAFVTTRDAVLSTDRQRPATEARAVAVAAGGRSGTPAAS